MQENGSNKDPRTVTPLYIHENNAQQQHTTFLGTASQSLPRNGAVTNDMRTEEEFDGRFFGLEKESEFYLHHANDNAVYPQRFVRSHETRSPLANGHYEKYVQDDDAVTMESEGVVDLPERDDKVIPDVSRPEIAWRVRKYNAIQFLYSRFESSEIFAFSNEQIRDIIDAAPAEWGEQYFPVHSVPWLQQALLERKKKPSKRSTPKPTPPATRHSPARTQSSASSSSTKRSTAGLTGDIRAVFKKRKRVITRPQLSGPSMPAPTPTKAKIVDELENLENMMSNAHVASPEPSPSQAETSMNDD